MADPRVFISYSHDSEVHDEVVLQLAQRLRRMGIDVQLDRFVSDPPEGWPRWMMAQIDTADLALLVCSATYRRRFEGLDPGADRGVTLEGMLAIQHLYDADTRNQKFIPVVFEGESDDVVPLVLRPYTRYTLPRQFDQLYRRLTDQPEFVAAPLGPRRLMPPRDASLIVGTLSPEPPANAPAAVRPSFDTVVLSAGGRDVSVTPLEALHRLLCGIFGTGEEFRRWIALGPDGGRLVAELPGTMVSTSAMVSDGLDILYRRGYLGDDFFARLTDDFVRRGDDIDRVATVWRRRTSSSLPVFTATHDKHTTMTPSQTRRRQGALSTTTSSPQARGAELFTSDGGSLPLVGAQLRVEAEGGLARVVLEQTFQNRHDETLHVTYRMPLPADGVVSGYEFRVGSRTVRGRVEVKTQARERFAQAIAAGKTAGLLEQQRSDIFTQEIGNLPPRTTLVARITVDQLLAWLPEGQWELRFPTVIGPRYVGAADSEADAAAVHIAVAERTGARIHLELRIRDEIVAGHSVESPSHQLTRGAEDRTYILAADGAHLDRDIVARWSVAGLAVGVSLAIGRPAASAAHMACAYGLLTIVPPTSEVRSEAFARDVIVLLDTSGSMDGAPLEQAKELVKAILNSLGDTDRLELIEFSDTPNPWRLGPEPATRANRLDAVRWLEALRANGATEMYTAVLCALQSLRPYAQRQVVLVTDGQISGEQQIVDTCHERLPAGCRLHMVGVGPAVNRSLATALSRAGRGAGVLVGLDEDVEPTARHLLERMVAPVLTDLFVGGDVVLEHAPEHVPDVFAGAPLRAAVKLASEGGEMVVRGNLAYGTWERRVRVPATRPGAGNQAIAALYAREHVADLETLWTIGREAQHIDSKIERIGCMFQISTRHTSWIAVDDQPNVDPTRGSRHELQPQEFLYGTSLDSFGLSHAPSPTRAMAPAPIGDTRKPTRVAGHVMPPPSPIPAFENPSERTTILETRAARSSPLPAPAARYDVAGRDEHSVEMAAPYANLRPWRIVIRLLVVIVLVALIAFFLLRAVAPSLDGYHAECHSCELGDRIVGTLRHDLDDSVDWEFRSENEGADVELAAFAATDGAWRRLNTGPYVSGRSDRLRLWADRLGYLLGGRPAVGPIDLMFFVARPGALDNVDSSPPVCTKTAAMWCERVQLELFAEGR